MQLVRRYVNACDGKSCQIGYPSCNMGPVPNSKVDVNNCGGVASDYIGGSKDYPEANWTMRRQIWLDHMYVSTDFGMDCLQLKLY